MVFVKLGNNIEPVLANFCCQFDTAGKREQLCGVSSCLSFSFPWVTGTGSILSDSCVWCFPLWAISLAPRIGSLNVFTNPFVAGRDRALRWNKSVLGVLHIFLMQEATLGLPFPLITFHLSYIGIHSCVCVPFTLTVKYHQRCEISQPPPPTTYFANVDSSRFLG